MNRPKVV